MYVGPCIFPRIVGWTTGPYWVLYYDETEGLAVISGGQPDVLGPNGCTFKNKTNGAGLWIFTREKNVDSLLIEKGKMVFKLNGFDTSVLNNVD